MTDLNLDVQYILACGNQLGESPVWDPHSKLLYWLDIDAKQIHVYAPESQTHRLQATPQTFGCILPRQAGGWIAATESGFARYDGETLTPLVDVGGTYTRFNDGAVDAAGRVWAGTIADDNRGTLYRLDPDQTTHTIDTGFGVCNGIDWSPDGKTMYFTASRQKTIYAYDFDPATGMVSNRRPFATFNPDVSPDGLCVDADGTVWVACWSGWRVESLAPDGTRMGSIHLPVSHPTSVAFGGDDLQTLYITSASRPANRDAQPQAGDLFAVRVASPGRVVHRSAL